VIFLGITGNDRVLDRQNVLRSCSSVYTASGTADHVTCDSRADDIYLTILIHHHTSPSVGGRTCITRDQTVYQYATGVLSCIERRAIRPSLVFSEGCIVEVCGSIGISVKACSCPSRVSIKLGVVDIRCRRVNPRSSTVT